MREFEEILYPPLVLVQKAFHDPGCRMAICRTSFHTWQLQDPTSPLHDHNHYLPKPKTVTKITNICYRCSHSLRNNFSMYLSFITFIVCFLPECKIKDSVWLSVGTMCTWKKSPAGINKVLFSLTLFHDKHTSIQCKRPWKEQKNHPCLSSASSLQSLHHARYLW